MLEAGGIRSVSDTDTREQLGVNGHRGEDLSGILFPYFSPTTGQRTGAQVKLDHPVDRKYLMEEGCRHLFFPRGIPLEWFADVSVPVIFVESEKSALAIYALSQRLGLKVIPIAIAGCWSWKRNAGRQVLPDGSVKYVTGPSPDFDLCSWPERKASVLFDSNVATNFDVQWARVALSNHLASLGAKVLWTEGPVIAGVNGPDDFIAQSTDDEALERMLNKVTPYQEKKEDKSETQAVQMVDTATAIVKELFHSQQVGYAVVPADGHEETWRIGSAMFERYVCFWFYRAHGKIPGAQVVNNALRMLEAKANFDGDEQPVFVRVASLDDCLWLDLANERWQAVRIAKEGWTIVENPGVRFLRPRGCCPCPLPNMAGPSRICGSS